MPSKGPLSGVRALELAEIWAGPFCGVLMGDMGAEVIKVEAIQRIARGLIHPNPDTPGYPEDEPGERAWNRQANFNALNRNKLGVTLDLGSEEGREAFKEMASLSDVVFSNYAFGVMDRLGLGYEELRKVKPDLIVLFTPGYGNTGPYKKFHSMGMAIDALSGHSALRGYPDMDLSNNSLVHHPDAVGGVTAYFAICAALLYRARTGKGQFIDLSQAETFMPHLGEIFLKEQMTGRPRERRGNRHPAIAPQGCYLCTGEDQWVTLSIRNNNEWHALCALMGVPDLGDDGRFGTLAARLENQDALDEIIGEWTATRDKYDIFRLLQAKNIPAGPVLDCGADTYEDPHLQARDYFQVVTHPDAGTYPMSGPIWKFLGNSDKGRFEKRHEHAPTLGEHNEYLLGEVLGYPDERMRELESKQVIGTIPLEGADMGGVRRVQREAR
ncbi:MAG: CoA transferase [Chloroflexi bacterium]|nr:CoA transferase [Chloroflexota bacterium]MDA1226613.1 CoA transferase [Chloroflexota bacterium]